MTVHLNYIEPPRTALEAFELMPEGTLCQIIIIFGFKECLILNIKQIESVFFKLFQQFFTLACQFSQIV